MITIIGNVWKTLLSSSTLILLGFLIAGLIRVYLPDRFLSRTFGSKGIMPLLRAIGMGSLLPICSCGVVPLGIGAYRSGAGRGTVLCFMTAAPVLSPAGVLLALKLLGVQLALSHLGCVIIGSFLLGLIGNRILAEKFRPEPQLVNLEIQPAVSCSAKHEENEVTPDCCAGKEEPSQKSQSGFFGSLYQVVHWIFWEFGPSISLDLMLGLTLAALILGVVPAETFSALTGTGTVISMLSVILIAIPVYTCSLTAIPIAFQFLIAGMSPGAAIAFLIGGPATNLGEINAIRHQMSWRSAVYYISILVLIAVVSGLAVDHLLGISSTSSPAIREHLAISSEGVSHHHGVTATESFSFWQVIDTMSAVIMLMMTVLGISRSIQPMSRKLFSMLADQSKPKQPISE